MFSTNSGRGYLTILSLLMISGRYVKSKGCTGNQPLVSGLYFSVLDYQMWSNSNDTTSYPGSVFGENSDTEMLISYEGRIGADYYRGWCSEDNPTEQPFLQIDFKREVIIQQVETQGLQLNSQVPAARPMTRYIKDFWLAYSTNEMTPFINVTETNSSLTKMFSGQNESDHTTSVMQNLPQPITARIVRLYPNESVPATMACLKLELHGCVPQREEECRSVYPLSCCSYGTPGDIIGNVEVTSENLDDDKPGPVANILSYYDNTKYWCGRREKNLLPINATFYFTEEVLLTSVAFHGFDGPLGDDYVTQYSWEYSVGNSTFEIYTDLGNNTVLENTREDRFQQTFWTPIHVQILKFVAIDTAIRPCMAFKFYGCKLNEVISASLSPTSTSSISTTTEQLSTYFSTSNASSSASSTVVLSDSVTTQCSSSMILSTTDYSTVTSTSTIQPTATMTLTVMVTSTVSSSTSSPLPTSSTSQESDDNCVGNEEPLISGTRYYANNNQLSASGHDPLHYTYSNMNERVKLVPQEGRIGNMYSSFLGWCSQKVTNIMSNAPYIQVDFSAPVVVTSVAVQGFEINGDNRQPRYVREFQLAYKDLKSDEFCTINNENNQSKNFTGNNENNYLEPIKSPLAMQVRGKTFRLYPQSWKSEAVVNDNDRIDIDRACIKWELYGCASQNTKAQDSCYPNHGLISTTDVNVTSNSRSVVVASSLFRLADSNDNWCPSTEEIDLPLVIDFSFAEMVLLTSVAIAGRKTNDADYFVSSYSLLYATNTSCNLTLYEDLLGQSVFYNDHVRTFFHSFWEPIYVHRLQLLITDWHITPCVSIGFFGCRSSEVNSNSTTISGGMGDILPQSVCNAPTNNLLLSCVNAAGSSDSDSDNNAVTTVGIVLLVCLATLLLIIVVLLLLCMRKLKFKKSSYSVRSPIFMQSDNPLYESNQQRVKFLDDDDESQNYCKLQHHHKDDSSFSSNLYSALKQQSTQAYAQDGPKESTTNAATHEELPYYEMITSKTD